MHRVFVGAHFYGELYNVNFSPWHGIPQIVIRTLAGFRYLCQQLAYVVRIAEDSQLLVKFVNCLRVIRNILL
jgi:hypothetical protein